MFRQQAPLLGFFVWYLIFSTVGFAVGYLVASNFVPKLERWLSVIGFVVGILVAMRIGTMPGSFHVFLFGIVGATIMCIASLLTSAYDFWGWVALGALGGFVVGLTFVNGDNIRRIMTAIRSQRR